MSDKVRAEFEYWASDDGEYPAAVERDGHGYKLAQIQTYWQAWLAAKELYEPATVEYYAIVSGSFIQMDTRSGQLEIYESEEEAETACHASCEVIAILARKKVSAPSTQGGGE